MKPSIGRIVIYRPRPNELIKLGGNHEQGITECPAIIVKMWGDAEESAVNLKVLGDSANDIWVTSAMKGEQVGQWSEPKRIQ